MDWLAGLLLIGVGQGLFLLVLLSSRARYRTPANLFLAGIVGCIALTILSDVLLRLGIYDRYPDFAGVDMLVLPLIGPLIYLHVDALLETGDWHFDRRHRGWLISAVIGVVAVLGVLAMPSVTRLAVLRDVDVVFAPSGILTFTLVSSVYLLAFVQQGIALRFGIGAIRNAHGLDSSVASRLPWLRSLLIVAMVCWLGFGVSLAAGLIDSDIAAIVEAVASLVYIIALYALGLLGLVRPDALLQTPDEVVSAITTTGRSVKYARSAMADEDVSRIAAKLEAAMRGDRLFLDPSLNLPKLAAVVGASTNDVSQAINTAFDRNYYEYVNRYRIDEAKRLLSDPKLTDTLLDVLLAVGFNSKSVFNAAFRRETGMAPSEYRRHETRDAASAGR